MSGPIYGLYDPEGEGVTLYETEEARNRAAADVIQGYLEEQEWSEGVNSIYGFVVTHRTTQVDKKDRPKVDEDGLGEDGNYWPPGIDYQCNYALAEIKRHLKEPEPDTDAVLALAAIIREVHDSYTLGAAALAEAILSHPCSRWQAAAPPDRDASTVAPLLWVLWHHQGSRSQVGQAIRKYLGIGQFQRMTSKQVEAAKKYGGQL